MKTLFILRHAKSDWNNAGEDHDRPLNHRGRRDAPQIGRLLASLPAPPRRIIASTARRAQETAQAVHQQLGSELPLDSEPNFYLAPHSHYLAKLQTLDSASDPVLVVGHNPGLEALLTLLTGQFEPLPTAALAQIDLPIDHWADLAESTVGHLCQLWRPKELETPS